MATDVSDAHNRVGGGFQRRGTRGKTPRGVCKHLTLLGAGFIRGGMEPLMTRAVAQISFLQFPKLHQHLIRHIRDVTPSPVGEGNFRGSVIIPAIS